MDEYIKRETLLNKLSRMIDFCEKDKKVTGLTALFQVGDAIMDCPAADVAPVAHGRWLKEEKETYCPVQYGEDGEPILHKFTLYFCNLCGRSSGIPEPYCHCGAKMDGGTDNAST